MVHETFQQTIEMCAVEGGYLSDMMLLEYFERDQLLNRTLQQQRNGRIEISSCLDGDQLECLVDKIQCEGYKYIRRKSNHDISFFVENSRADHALDFHNSIKGKVKYYHSLETSPVWINMKKPGNKYPWCFVHFQGMEQKDFVYPVSIMLHYIISRFRTEPSVPASSKMNALFNRYDFCTKILQASILYNN